MVEPRAWQRMLSGRRLDLLDPSPLDVEIEDIALGLSRVARWNGQTRGRWPYTVAQHSLLVEQLAGHFRPRMRRDWRLTALLHDGAEYVIGDLITPFKAAVGEDYKALERRLMTAIYLRFGLPARPPQELARLVKRADRAAAYLEATQLAGFAPGEAKRLFGHPRGMVELALDPAPPAKVEPAFLARFQQLYRNPGSP